MKTKKYYMLAVACLICVTCLFSTVGRVDGADKDIKSPSDNIIASRLTSKPKSDKGQRKVNLNLSKETAVKIAEVILASIYGEKVLEQRPWKVTETDTDFEIKGTFHSGKSRKGGVAEITISKTDARVIKYTHGL